MQLLSIMWQVTVSQRTAQFVLTVERNLSDAPPLHPVSQGLKSSQTPCLSPTQDKQMLVHGTPRGALKGFWEVFSCSGDSA